jgi:hypothetical protein
MSKCSSHSSGQVVQYAIHAGAMMPRIQGHCWTADVLEGDVHVEASLCSCRSIVLLRRAVSTKEAMSVEFQKRGKYI